MDIEPPVQDPREVEAHRFNLNYIGMEGNIACLGEFWFLDYGFFVIMLFSGSTDKNYKLVSSSIPGMNTVQASF